MDKTKNFNFASIAFPKIFSGSSVKLVKDYDAVKSDLQALLCSEKGTLFGDPYYGTKIKELLWEQAHDYVVRDMIRDDIFEAIYSYMPQITVNRDDIKITITDTQQGTVVSATINVNGDSSVESNLYEITLLAGSEN